MTKTQTRRLFAALGMGAALTLAAVTSSNAQNAPRGLPANPPDTQAEQPYAAPDGQDYRPYAPRPRDGRVEQRFGDRLERRLAFLHQRLGIRTNQERVWNAVVAEVREEARDMRDRFQDLRDRFRDRRGAGRDDREQGVLQRLERRRAMLENQSERLEHLLAVMQPLYDTLDQNQRRIADRLLFQAEGFGGRGGFMDRRGPEPRADRGRFGNGYDGLRYGDGARGYRGERPDRGYREERPDNGFEGSNAPDQNDDGQPPQ